MGWKDGFDKTTEGYKDNLAKYGHSELTLWMPSDRRNIRYYELIKNFDFFLNGNKEAGFTICDAGCGFGDINKYFSQIGIKNYSYIGLDVVEELLEAGRKAYGKENVDYIFRNFITDDITDLEFDYAITSQTFTIQYEDGKNNHELIETAISKLFKQCKKGVSFNFNIDKVEFTREGVAYHSPARLLDFAYTLSHNVILDNSCFPYECTITVLKDNTASDRMVFDRFKELHRNEFAEGIFVVNPK